MIDLYDTPTTLAEMLAHLTAWGSRALDRSREGLEGIVAGASDTLARAWSGDGDWAAVVTAFTAALAVAVLAVRFARRHGRRQDSDSGSRLGRRLLGVKLLGYVTIAVGLVGLGAWSATAPLTSAAIAPGVVSPDGDRKTVQHLEGGIIRTIRVREGDTVVAGQPLVVLEDTEARGDYEEMRQRYVHLLVTEARLMAEEGDRDRIEPPAELARISADETARALTSQQQLFASRTATRDGRQRILGQRIRQLEAEIGGLEQVIAAQDEQLGMIAQEVASVQTLYDKGLARLPRLLELKRQRAELRGLKAQNRAAIARNQQHIGETEVQLLTMRQQHLETVSEQLTEIRADLAGLRSQLPSRRDRLARTEVVAPISGTVMNVRVTTETGVVSPGEPLLDIVPDNAPLVIDARVKPLDVDTVRPGQRARILLTAYRQRNLHHVYGRLRSVSADRLVDERTGEAYFLAKVEVGAEDLRSAGAEIDLTPGMPADVIIITGVRTVFDYVVQPLQESLVKSFRE